MNTSLWSFLDMQKCRNSVEQPKYWLLVTATVISINQIFSEINNINIKYTEGILLL